MTAYSKNRFVIRANSIKIGVAGGFYFSGKGIKEPKSDGKIKTDLTESKKTSMHFSNDYNISKHKLDIRFNGRCETFYCL